MTSKQVLTIVKCLLGAGPREFKIKSFHPSAPSVKGGTVQITTIEGYEMVVNVSAGEVTSVHSATTPKGKIWKEKAGDNLILDASQSTEITALLSHSKSAPKIEVVQIWQVNINGCRVGRMYDKGNTKKGISYPKELAINSYYSEEEAEEACKKFRLYHEARESELKKKGKKK